VADGSAPTPLKLTFPADTEFQRDLKARVDRYFEERGLDKGATPFMWVKVAFWLTAAFAALLSAGLAPVPPLVSLGLWLLAGFCFAGVGFNVAHDGTHGSMSSKKWVNTLCSFAFDGIGVSSDNWRVAHNLLHHTYTNVVGADTDIEPGIWMRFHPYSKHYAAHRFQAIYCWSMYCLTSILWVYHKDFFQAMQPHPRTGAPTPKKTWAALFIGKALHISVFLGVPLAFGPQTVGTVIGGYVLLHAFAGFTLAVVFQLAHVVEGVRFMQPTDGRLPRGWMEHELLTTANFGKSSLCNFITGGLDHQIEHHLFPTICHVHYRNLSPIVKQCATDHGIPYLHSGTFLQAVRSHARMMWRLGNQVDVNALAVDVPRDHRAAAALAA
jgi:linoleoyl-CoA desaturase